MARKHATKLNFRPNMSDGNPETKGTKPTSDPSSIVDIFTFMILYICKKSLFLNTNLKIIIYLGCLFIISFISDMSTIPKSYFSRSDNILNKYFVKFAWGWNLILIVPFVTLTTYIYCCGQKQRIIKHHFLRIMIATFFWWFWTKMFNVVEANFGKCVMKGFYSKATCLHEGHIWHGFDISGHSFILVYGSLFLIEEARCMINWDSIKEHLRLEEHQRSMKEKSTNNPLRNLTQEEFKSLQVNYEKYTPYIRIIFIVIAIFQIIWDIMLISTILYYHVMVEKLIGGLIAIGTWFLTYQIWFAYPHILPNLPGEGVFKYIKAKVTKEKFPAARRRLGSVINNHQGPTFMGRPLYPENQDTSLRDDSTK